MAQKSQIVDLTKSYLVTDPNAFLENMVSTDKEDGEERQFPILPYDGYNFLPTDYGYRSYFGQTSTLDASPLLSRTQYILGYQATDLHNWLIALCEDGIWVLDTRVGGAWNHLVIHSYNSNIFEQWTFCTIENTLYMYKQGTGVVYNTLENASTFTLELPSFIPSFLTMSGQLGIFKAGTRLGFWDSLNSISWSNTFSVNDFTPSLETLSGNMILNEVLGKIISVKESGEGFIIYASGSIIGAALHTDTSMMWDTKKIMNLGIINPRNVCFGKDNSEHFVWTTGGFLTIGKYVPISGKYEAAFSFQDIYDFLRESRSPIYLECIRNRYLCIQTFVDTYSFTTPAPLISIPQGNSSNGYNTLKSAVVYDIDLKKWGKWKYDYTAIVEFTGLNAANASNFTYTDLGMTAGLLHSDGLIYMFDHKPVDSWITYGKIGYYRLGMVHFLESRIDFREYASGSLTLDFSMDGRNVDQSLQQVYNYSDVLMYRVYPNQRSRWSTLTISGNYDLQYMEVRGNISCRR